MFFNYVMKGTILQPTYLPWLGYFEMIDSSDLFVVFDHVQFVKKSWQQRNRIKTANGISILTIPVQREGRSTRIADVKISYDRDNPLEKHWKTITLAYGKSKYFDDYSSYFEKIYSVKHVYLRDLNVAIIKQVCDLLHIKTKIIFSSKLDISETEDKTENIISLCEKVGITSLYDAKGAEIFINKSLFEKSNINITFQSFNHPVYNQLWGEFVPQMSIIDLLFNEGDKSIEIIRCGRSKTTN